MFLSLESTGAPTLLDTGTGLFSILEMKIYGPTQYQMESISSLLTVLHLLILICSSWDVPISYGRDNELGPPIEVDI